MPDTHVSPAPASAAPDSSLISANELQQRLAVEAEGSARSGGPRIIDATVHLSFDEQGAHIRSGRDTFLSRHLPGAVFFDNSAELRDVSNDEALARFANALSAAGIGNDDDIVVYDQVNGIWATRLWWQLRLAGAERVAVLDGGIEAWLAAGLPVESGEPQASAPAAAFELRPRTEIYASTADVEAALDDDETVIIHALDRESYAQGRIPGAVNVPFNELVHPNGELRSVDELRQLFAGSGALDPGRRVITYCGGGIAATGAALALAELGRTDAIVYDGSLREWALDPARPLDTD